jgi:hypothetical protein
MVTVTSAPPASGFNTKVPPLIDFTVPIFRAGAAAAGWLLCA